MKHITVYKEQDRYCSFPHIVRLPNGGLIITFRRASKFSADAALSGVATHHDPDSEIMIIQSADNGNTWPIDSLRIVYKSNYGVNDPSLTVLRDGSIINRFVALDIRPTQQWDPPPNKIFSHRVEHGLITSVVGNLIVKSYDMGLTWHEIGTADVASIGPSCSRDPVVEMHDGSWLMPVYVGAPQRSDVSWVIRSFDQGKTWCEPIQIMSDESGKFSQLQGINYNETSLLPLGDSEIVALVRADATFHTENEFMPVGGVGDLRLARSFDSGLSWSPPMRTGIWGQPGSLTKLHDGRLLATYGYRKKPFGVRCCLSADRGHTWDTSNEIIIRDDSPTWDCGYPFTIQLDDQRLLTVYYFVDDQGIRHIAGTHWDLT
jgi:sialidase-1